MLTAISVSVIRCPVPPVVLAQRQLTIKYIYDLSISQVFISGFLYNRLLRSLTSPQCDQ